MFKDQVKDYVITYCQNKKIPNYSEIIDFIKEHNFYNKIMDRPKNKRPIIFTQDKKFSIIKCSKQYYNSIEQPIELETCALLDNFIVSKRFENIETNVYQNHIVYNNKLIIIDEEIAVKNPNIYSHIEQNNLSINHLTCVDDMLEYCYKNFYIYDFFKMNVKIKTNAKITMTNIIEKNLSVFIYHNDIFSLTPEKYIRKISKNDFFEICEKNNDEKSKKHFLENYHIEPNINEKKPIRIEILEG